MPESITLMHCNENPSCNQRWLRILVNFCFLQMVQLNLLKEKFSVKRWGKMCYSQGSELTSFIDDAFCCVLFKVKQRTMKKIQAIPHSCRKQDKSSVKHGSIFFFLRQEPQYWQMLGHHFKISIFFVLGLPLNSHIHLILCTLPQLYPTYAPASDHSENISLKDITIRWYG